MKRFERVMIAGVGIRCLTATIALRRAGFEVAIFEHGDHQPIACGKVCPTLYDPRLDMDGSIVRI